MWPLQSVVLLTALENIPKFVTQLMPVGGSSWHEFCVAFCLHLAFSILRSPFLISLNQLYVPTCQAILSSFWINLSHNELFTYHFCYIVQLLAVMHQMLKSISILKSWSTSALCCSHYVIKTWQKSFWTLLYRDENNTPSINKLDLAHSLISLEACEKPQCTSY